MRPLAVLTLTRVSDENRRLLQELGVHLVEPYSGETETINHRIGRSQAEFLIGRGHTRLAFAHLRDMREDPFGHAREAGVREVCAQRGLAEPAILNLGIDLEQGCRELELLRERGQAVACYNDDVAMTLMAAARELGWRIPNDLAVIGMDHTPVGRLQSPRLATMEVDLRVATQQMLRSVLEGIQEEPLAPARAPSSRLPLRIIDGESA